MKNIFFNIVVMIFLFANLHLKAQTVNKNDCDFFDSVVNNHNQIYESSCIPSSIEMILKYCKVVDFDFLICKTDGKIKWMVVSKISTIKNYMALLFSHKFHLPRNTNFPIDSLFQTIEKELKSEKKVIISLPSDMGGWHMFVIHKQTPEGEFIAYSKQGIHTLILRDTKERVKRANGTDIMTYSSK